MALIAITVSCRHSAHKAKMPLLKVEVAQAQSADIPHKIEVASTIESLYDVVIEPRISGFLSSINYSEGMPIKRGKLLFTIDPEAYNIARMSAQSDLEYAQAQEILAKNNYERAVPLARIDAISQSDLDQYTATHSASIASTKTAQEALNNAELNLSYTRIYAPIDGLVAKTPANKGDYVGIGTAMSTLTTISYIDTIEVSMPIPTSIYLQATKGAQRASFDNSKLLSDITLSLSGGEIYPLKGRYSYTAKDSPSISSSVVIVVKFPNPDMQLKARMFARVSANIGQAQPQVIVPQIAVSQNQGINSVWVVRPDSVVEFREVVLGATSGNNWVVNSGVKEGESVLTSGQLKVHKGMKVAPQKR